MNRFSLILLGGMILMLSGISGVSRLSERAIGLGFDGSVVDNVHVPARLLVLGFVGTEVASELIRRGESTVIVNDEGTLDNYDPMKGKKPGDLAR